MNLGDCFVSRCEIRCVLLHTIGVMPTKDPSTFPPPGELQRSLPQGDGFLVVSVCVFAPFSVFLYLNLSGTTMAFKHIGPAIFQV